MDHRTRLSEACDACKRRKVKCNRGVRCSQCEHLALKCIYSGPNPAARTRRSIIRGSVIQAFRDDSSPLVPGSGLSAPDIPDPFRSDSPGWSPAVLSTSADFFTSLKEDYATHALPTLPIITLPEYEAAIKSSATDPETQALLNVLGAAALNMTVLPREEQHDRQSKIKSLCFDAMRLRGPVMAEHNISVRNTVVSLLMASYLFTVDRDSLMGWFYFGEAVTCISLLYEKQMHLTRGLKAQGQLLRLYWVTWIHERFYAITSRRRPTLPTLDFMPPLDSDLPIAVSKGFNHLVTLWRIIDDDFVSNWLNEKSPSLTSAWVEAKQSQLGNYDCRWEYDTENLPQKVPVDLVVTRYWFQTLIWQMALSALLLKSNETSQAKSMTFIFPAHISRSLRVVLTNVPRGLYGVHGTGGVHKAFDIVSTLADLLEHTLPTMCDAQTIADYIDDFTFMYTYLNSMPIIYDTEKAVLESRHKTLSTMYPHLMS